MPKNRRLCRWFVDRRTSRSLREGNPCLCYSEVKWEDAAAREGRTSPVVVLWARVYMCLGRVGAGGNMTCFAKICSVAVTGVSRQWRVTQADLYLSSSDRADV